VEPEAVSYLAGPDFNDFEPYFDGTPGWYSLQGARNLDHGGGFNVSILRHTYALTSL
jgi:hypothetical protein